METISIRVDCIELGERHRALSEDAVARLAGSISEIGLKQPISVRVLDEMEIDGEMVSGVPLLVAGAHRLAAAKKLGWSHIDCFEVDDDPISAELWEIAENLHRLDLKPAERDEHLRRYAQLIEARRTQDRIVGQNVKQSVGRPKSIVTEVAEATGVATHTVRRALNPSPAPEPKAPLPDYDVVTVQYNALMAAWNRAGPEARERFMEQIDAPVFDRSRAA